MPVFSSSAASEGVTAHYGWCVVDCIVVGLFLIVVVDQSCVVGVSVVAVFFVVCVMFDAVGLLIVMFCFYVRCRVESGDFIVKLRFQSVNVSFEVTIPHSCSPSDSSFGDGGTMPLVLD